MSPNKCTYERGKCLLKSFSGAGTPVGIYLLKVNNRNIRARCEICSKLAIKTPEQRYTGTDSNILKISHHIRLFIVLHLLRYSVL